MTANAHSSNAASPPKLANVLVVDDNDAAVELARISLLQRAKLSCNLESAPGGEEALIMLRIAHEQGRYVDLILLDINMPRMDGFEVLSEVAAQCAWPKPAIVMCSSLASWPEAQRARSLGAAGCVEKPPRLEALRPLLASASHLRLEEDASGARLVRAA